MRCPPTLVDEAERQEVLAEYGLEPGKPLKSLDRVVDIATKLFDMPVSTVNIVGSDATFHAAQRGISAEGGSRDISFCAHAVAQEGVMVVEDALADERFHDNPLVTEGIVRFYAGVPLRAPSGHALGALCVIDTKPRHDFSAAEQKRLTELAAIVQDELELAHLHRRTSGMPSRIAALAGNSPNAIICFDAKGTITEWSGTAEAMFGYARDEAIGMRVHQLIAEEDQERVAAAMRRVVAGGATSMMGVEMTAVHASGRRFPIEHFSSTWNEGEELHFGAVVRDLSERQRERDALHYLTNFDELTGLPNRSLVHRRAQQAIEAGGRFVLVVVDLKGFDEVNSALGRAAGDQLLRIAADRIKAAVPRGSVVGRMGFDRFAVLVPAPSGRPEAVADSIRLSIAAPITLGGYADVRIDGWCGVATAPDGASSVDELLGNADLALFDAKSRGGSGGVRAYVPAMRSAAIARRMFETELHRALERGEFRLFYQPQIDLASGRPIGAEALIRWQHPVRGLLAPAAFLPQLEGGTLAEAVGTWVLDTACAELARWRRWAPEMRMSVNLFGAQFRGGALPAKVAETLARHGVPPAALELEITENIVLNETVNVVPQLVALRETGVLLSFDDFGTGFASLNMLRSVPITHIKIDKSFIQALSISEPDRAIVRSIIGLAHDLRLRVIAEGIETAENLDFLATLKCDTGQGYFYGKPMPADVFVHQFLDSAASRAAC